MVSDCKINGNDDEDVQWKVRAEKNVLHKKRAYDSAWSLLVGLAQIFYPL